MNTMKSLVTLLALLSGASALVTTTGGKSEVRRASISQSFGLLLESSTTVEKESTSLSPFLQEMVDEQRELQMDVGKAMDVLRKDYPYFLKRAPGKNVTLLVPPSDNWYDSNEIHAPFCNFKISAFTMTPSR